MLSYNDYVMKREQYGDVLRAAERERLLRPSRAGNQTSMASPTGLLATIKAGLLAVRRQVTEQFGARPLVTETSRRRPAAAR